jgi:hypothetical protein
MKPQSRCIIHVHVEGKAGTEKGKRRVETYVKCGCHPLEPDAEVPRVISISGI